MHNNVGCTCDEDCGAGHYCEHNICVKKATVEPTNPMSTPCSGKPIVTVSPVSRTTQQYDVGCTCDDDCGEGYYCEYNICVKKGNNRA